jgi:hypothetical protein
LVTNQNEYEKFVGAISSAVYYHIHVTLEAVSRDSNQFFNAIGNYADDMVKEGGVRPQYTVIYKTFLENYQGTKTSTQILCSFLCKHIHTKYLDKYNTSTKVTLFAKILMSTIKSYAKYLSGYDDQYFFGKQVNKSKHVRKIQKILTDEATNANYAIDGVSQQVSRARYDDLLKRYKYLERKYKQLEQSHEAMCRPDDPITSFINDLE